MNWILFAILTYVCLLLQVGTRALLGLPDAQGASPDFLLILAVFVGMNAPSRNVAWAMLVIGLCANLLPGPVGEGPIIGPEALGYLAGAFAVLQLRGLVFRESVISLAILTFLVGVFIHLTIVALYTGRGVPLFLNQPIPQWDAMDELYERFLTLMYSAIAALPVGVVLMRLAPAMRFTQVQRGERAY